MSATRRPTTALVTALLIAVLALPAAAVARPAADPSGATSSASGTTTETMPAAPAPVAADDGTDVLPIVLGGAALILALGGAGYVLVQASHRRPPHALR